MQTYISVRPFRGIIYRWRASAVVSITYGVFGPETKCITRHGRTKNAAFQKCWKAAKKVADRERYFREQETKKEEQTESTWVNI